MRQPGWHWLVALLRDPLAAWQTSPAQHCASLVHFAFETGAAGLQSVSAAAGAMKPARAPATRRTSEVAKRRGVLGGLPKVSRKAGGRPQQRPHPWPDRR